MPGNKWFIKLFDEWACKEAYHIVLTTDDVCHLWLRWSFNKPQKHPRTLLLRGLPILGDVYYCFTAYFDIEQEEAGDTLTHTFIAPGWTPCQTRYFYFHGRVGGYYSPSTSPIFGRHMTYTTHDLSATITHEYDVAIAFMGLIWSFPPSCPAFVYTGNSQGPGRPIGGALRFRNLLIPRCAEILEANLWLMAWGNTDKTPVHSRLSAEDEDHANDFYDISDALFWARWATRTGIRDWDNIPPWLNGVWYESPAITTALGNVVARSGWQIGNALVLYWEDFEQRTPFGFAQFRICRAYVEGLPGIPVLVIHYNHWQIEAVSPW